MRTRQLWLALLPLATPLAAQLPDPISETGFEVLPSDYSLVAVGGITLDGPTTVTEGLLSQGTIETTGQGYVFPDGSLQTTANNNTGASANAGLYENRIVLMTPPAAFTEVCFKAGAVHNDIHSISESSAGGNCLPGDIGWIIERDQRTTAQWAGARVACLTESMRLPEPFEWLYSCTNAAALGLISMTGDSEWMSNTTTPILGTNSGAGVISGGLSSCGWASFSWAASSTGAGESRTFRCVR